MPNIECANCDKAMKDPEASAFMTQYSGMITITITQGKPDSLPVHVHEKCRKDLPRTIVIRSNSSGKGPAVVVR